MYTACVQPRIFLLLHHHSRSSNCHPHPTVDFNVCFSFSYSLPQRQLKGEGNYTGFRTCPCFHEGILNDGFLAELFPDSGFIAAFGGDSSTRPWQGTAVSHPLSQWDQHELLSLCHIFSQRLCKPQGCGYRSVLYRETEWKFVSYCQGQDSGFRVRRACSLHTRASCAEIFGMYLL